MASEKTTEIKKVTMNLFGRHGYQKVTMSDIAEALGISRPTLYKSFANKEAIFDSVASDHIEQNKSETVRRIRLKKDLKGKLESIFDVWIIEPFASVIDSENGRDLLENGAVYAPETFNRIYAEFEKQLAQFLSSEIKTKSKLPAEDLAHILVLATRGLKATTKSLPELKRLVAGLVVMSLTSIA